MKLARTIFPLAAALLTPLTSGGCSAFGLPINGAAVGAGGGDGPAITDGAKASCTSGAFAWSVATVDSGLAPLNPFGGSTSLAADTTGNATITYGDDHLHVATRTPDGGWTTRTISGFGNKAEDGFQSVVQLDGAGRPVIAYAERSGPSSVEVRLGDGTVTRFFVGTQTVTELAMVLDGDGRPRIAFDDSVGGLGYAAFDGTSWHVEPLGGVGIEVSIALDGAGRPLIAHSTLDFRLEVARRADDGSWQRETVQSTPMAQLHSPTLLVDANGRPELVWIDGRSWLLEYGVRTDSGWQVETIGCAGEAAHASFALDAAGHAHVTFAARTDRPPAPLRHAVREGSGVWIVEPVSDGAEAAWWSSLRIGADGVARVSWYDFSAGTLHYGERR